MLDSDESCTSNLQTRIVYVRAAAPPRTRMQRTLQTSTPVAPAEFPSRFRGGDQKMESSQFEQKFDNQLDNQQK